ATAGAFAVAGIIVQNAQGRAAAEQCAALAPNDPGRFDACRVGCAAGEAEACASLGEVYKHGVGTPRDFAQAIDAFKKGCDGSNASACTNLGLMYAHGEGVPKDLAAAAALHTRACDNGSAGGCAALG